MSERPSGILMGTSAVIVAAGAVFAGIGATEAVPAGDSLFGNSWFDLGIALVIGSGVLGVLLPWFLYFRGRGSRRAGLEESGKPVPTTTIRGGKLTGGSQLMLDSSADILLDGTDVEKKSSVTGRHFPGRPDLFGDR